MKHFLSGALPGALLAWLILRTGTMAGEQRISVRLPGWSVLERRGRVEMWELCPWVPGFLDIIFYLYVSMS